MSGPPAIEAALKPEILRTMPELRPLTPHEPTVGALLQTWRKTRNLSQLALANEAEVSPRHLSFVETGRANPSREMVLRLASVLDVPLRERNALLLAAGFAPVFAESKMDAPSLAVVRNALDAILKQQEPYPAVVMNRAWDILATNGAATRFFGFLLGDRAASAPNNVVRMMFDPAAVRPYVANWESVAESLYHRIRREAVGGPADDAAKKLLAELAAYPDLPASFHTGVPSGSLLPIVPVSFTKEGRRFDFFSAVTTLGTPQDVTVQEIRIECFFPANDATAAAARALREGAS